MQPVLRSLILNRFRSIPAETVSLDNPTFLVGRNRSRKSNFRDAIDFLAEAMASPLQSVLDRRGGIAVVRSRTSGQSYPPNLGLAAVLGRVNGETEQTRYAFEVRATKNYGFEVVREQCVVRLAGGMTAWFDRDRRRFRSNVEGLRPALEPASLGLPVVGGEASFAPVLRVIAAMRTYSIEPEMPVLSAPYQGIRRTGHGRRRTTPSRVASCRLVGGTTLSFRGWQTAGGPSGAPYAAQVRYGVA